MNSTSSHQESKKKAIEEIGRLNEKLTKTRNLLISDREKMIDRKQVKSLPATTRNYILLHGLDREDSEMPDLSDFEWRMNIIAILPEQVGLNPVAGLQD